MFLWGFNMNLKFGILGIVINNESMLIIKFMNNQFVNKGFSHHISSGWYIKWYWFKTIVLFGKHLIKREFIKLIKINKNE